MIKLGFVSAILGEYNFEQVIDFAAAEKFDCVELMSWPVGRAERRYAGVTHIDATNLDAAAIEKIDQKLKSKGITISALGYYPNPLDPDLAQRAVYVEHIKKVIHAANLLGIGQMNTFIGKDPAVPISENFVQFKKIWPDIIKYAENENVRVGIENCPMYFKDEWPGGKNLASSPKIWREMFAAIDSPNFGLNYDPSHLVWQRMDYIKPIYEFRDKMFHFHIKDAIFYQDKYNEVGMFAAPLEYHAPKLPGLGDINWGKTFAALTDIGYKGCAVIEVEDRAFEDTLEDRLDSIRLSRDYSRQFVR